VVLVCASLPACAQVNYSVRFEREKSQYLLGEPVFCRFVIRNTGTQPFGFRYRTPSRTLGSDNDQEPRFVVTGAGGRRLRDPGPRPCGNPQGSAVYGSVTLPPGQVHTERWLLNQWAQFEAPGPFRVRAQRHLALLALGPQPGSLSDKPLAFALAINEIAVSIVPSTTAQVEGAFQPYVAAVRDAKNPNPSEAVVVLTSLPQPSFLDTLVAMTKPAGENRWDRRDALNSLARLNSSASWQALLSVLHGGGTEAAGAPGHADDSLRSYAALLLAEKGDPSFLPALIEVAAHSSDPLRGDVLRALGFFPDPRAYQTLFDNLHSAQVTDRMNAVLGLRNLGRKEVVPALIAALDDPEAQVRQVADFCLQGLSGQKFSASANSTPEQARRLAAQWHAWWRDHAANFAPPPPTTCHDW